LTCQHKALTSLRITGTKTALALRADQWLVQAGLAPTRTAAQRLIAAASVQFIGEPTRLVRKSGELVGSDQTLQVNNQAELAYVSRAGLKLAFALEQFRIMVSGLQCLDVGQSTGGFTDCLLASGARSVVGVDVGHDQIHPNLRKDPRVTVIEKLNIREPQALLALAPFGKFDLAVVDVSFISLTKVLPNIISLMKPASNVVLLYKPQFEVGPANVGKRGIVKDQAQVRLQLETSVGEFAQWANITHPPIAAPITGADGNQEYLLTLKTR
jgi:23S rRNA (cytidine1920-2'-O)/16S rRNA (cytidine1409-2'-O)-methyltransferase